MAAISPYLSTKILEHVLKNTNFSSSNAYLGLFKGNPYYGGIEVSASNTAYSRPQVAFTISGSIASNTSGINFSKATADWGTVSYFGLSDAATEGNLLFYGELPVSKTVYMNNTFFVNSAEIIVSLGNQFSVYLANKLLNHVLNNTAYTSPGLNVYIGIYTTLPDKNDSGGTEVSAVNYSRLKISGSGWSEIQTGPSPVYYKDIFNTITLPFCNDSQYTWGTLRGACLRDSISSGNQLFRGIISASPTLTIGDSFYINRGELVVEIN